MATAKKVPAKQPAAKKSSTAVAVRKPNAGAVADIRAALQAQAEEMGNRTMPASGNKITLAPGQFSLPDGTKTPGPIELVIVDFVTMHAWYPGQYDPKNPQPPGCFAIGQNPRDMAPSQNSPELQASNCQECPFNQFGSDGNGKACKNTRRLAVLPPDADEATPIWILDVSPTALRGFDGYVSTVKTTFKVPPVGVVTSVSLNDAVAFAQLKFDNPVPNENVAMHFGRQAEAREILANEPDVSQYVPAGKARTAARPAAKQVRR